MKKIILFLLIAVGSWGSAFAALDASQMANYDAAVASYKARLEAVKVNNAAAVVSSSLPSGATSANTFGNLTLKPVDQSDLAFSTKGNMTVGGKPLVIDVQAKVLKPSLVGALGRFAYKVFPVLNTGVALYDLVQEMEGWEVQKDIDDKAKFFKRQTVETTKSCVKFGGYGECMESPESQCASLGTPSGVVRNPDNSVAYCWIGSTEARFYPQWITTTGFEVQIKPMTPDAFAMEAVYDPVAINSPAMSELIRDSLASGEQIETGPNTATGPATTPGTTINTTSTAPDGTTTTTATTTTNHFTYAGDNITHSTTSTVQTCVGAGACSTTSTTTENPVSTDPVAPPEPTKTDCEKKPSMIGCSEYGVPEFPTLPRIDSALLVTPKTFSGAGSCPAPLSFTIPTGTYAIAFNPICEQMIYLKALMLALAGIMAAYILADSFKVG